MNVFHLPIYPCICSTILFISPIFAPEWHYASAENEQKTPSLSDYSCDADSPDWKTLNACGFMHYESGDYTSATHYYQKAIERNPKAPVPHNNLGVIYLRGGEMWMAEKHFQKAIDLDPSYVKAVINLAITNYKLGKTNAAKEFITRAWDIDPNYVTKRVDDYYQKENTR